MRLTTLSSRQPFSQTPGWRAPEQVYSDLRRRAHELGVENRIDVFQLGNLLLYLLAGETVDGEDAAKPGAVEEAVSRVEHPELRTLLRSMLALNPEDRPSAEEVLARLYQIYQSLGETQWAGRG